MKITRFEPSGSCPHEHSEHVPPSTRGLVRPPETGVAAALRAVPDEGLAPEVRFPVTRRELAAARRAAGRAGVTVEQLAYTALMRVVLGPGTVPGPREAA